MQDFNQFNFEPFAETVEYQKVNREIVRSWISTMVRNGEQRIDGLLDIATGVGTMAQLFLEELPSSWEEPEVLCLDKSEEALRLAKIRLSKKVNRLQVIHSPIEELEKLPQNVEVALWGNGIHNLSEVAQKEALQRIRKVVKPKWLFFNTAFYKEARPSGTLIFYRGQIKETVKILRKDGVRREKKQGPSEAAKFLTKSYYIQLTSQAGYNLQKTSEFTSFLSRKAMEEISNFRPYAAGALHGYPISKAADALKEAVAPALEKYGKEDQDGNLYIPRKWLAISACTQTG